MRENEYWNEKQLLENAQEDLKKFEELDVEKMNQDQLDARERGIRMNKVYIEESKGILHEIKGELEEFIANGGEVSKELKEELSNEDDSSEDVVEFKVERNGITISGYAYINELEDEHPLNFYNSQGIECGTRVPSNPYPEDTKEWVEYEKISSEFQSDDMFIQYLSDFSDENRTIDRGEYNLLINDGAKMECIIEEPSGNFRGDYMVMITPFFNGERIYLNEYLNTGMDSFDPYGLGDDENISLENGRIIFEISKDYFDKDEKENQVEIINEELRRIYAKALTYNMGEKL